MSDMMMVDVSLDWAIACDVQQRFMQGLDRTLCKLDYSAKCSQVLELGGDCYDFRPLSNDRLALAIGDASGKGLPAALMMANVLSSLRTAASFNQNNLSAVLSTVNRQVYASSPADRYATLFYGIFDGRTASLRYVNAGHNPPIVIRQNGSVRCLETGGVPVGLFPQSFYTEGAVQLHPGDVVLAYTDGVVEAPNPCGEEWGVERLRETAVQCTADSADDLVCALFDSMELFTRGRQTDDATISVLRI